MIPYYGDLAEDATIDVYLNTFTSDDPSASSTITNFANTDVHIHKDGGLTQRNNAAGITVSIDFDGITGAHLIKIDTSDDTVADFWVTGSDYMVRIEGTTIDGATINAAVATFSIENRFNEVDLTHIMGTILTEGGAGRLAASWIKFLDVATPAGTINSLPGADAEAAGGLFTRGSGAGQINQDTNGQIDVDLQKWLGATVPTPNVAGRPIVSGGYESGAVWINTLIANTNTVDHVDGTIENPVSTIAAATTIAASLGIKKFVLMAGSSITLAQTYDDYIFDAYHATIALGGQSVNNAIFNGATITGNDDGSNANHTQYRFCFFANSTLGQFVFTNCYMAGTITFAEAGDYYMHQCFSAVAGSGSPNLDFGAGLGASQVSMRDYSGGIEIENMGAGAGAYNMSLEGNGQLIINASCSATSDVMLRGAFNVTDNAGGAVTVTRDDDSANIIATDGKVDAIQTDLGDFSGRTNNQTLLDVLGVPDVAGKDLHTLLVTDRLDHGTYGLSAIITRGNAAWTTGSGTGLTAVATGTAQAGAAGTITLTAGASATDNLYRGTRIITTGGTGAGQSRSITAYNGTTKVATIFPNWITNPGADTTYEIQGADSSLGTIQHDGQSVTDLKDFADAGYDPGTNKVQGVVLVDLTTANSDMVSEPPSGAAIVNEWETQSQADPTGFRVNVMEIGGTAQTANDNGADINTLITRLTAARAGYLDELEATNLPSDIDGIKTVTDNLPDSGALTTMDGKLDTIDNFLDTEIAAILEDTGTTIPASIAALNDPTAAAIATAVMAKTVDGTIDVTEALTITVAALAGDIAKSGNTYTYKDQSDVTKITAVVSDSAVDRTIA